MTAYCTCCPTEDAHDVICDWSLPTALATASGDAL